MSQGSRQHVIERFIGEEADVVDLHAAAAGLQLFAVPGDLFSVGGLDVRSVEFLAAGCFQAGDLQWACEGEVPFGSIEDMPQ